MHHSDLIFKHTPSLLCSEWSPQPFFLEFPNLKKGKNHTLFRIRNVVLCDVISNHSYVVRTIANRIVPQKPTTSEILATQWTTRTLMDFATLSLFGIETPFSCRLVDLGDAVCFATRHTTATTNRD